jgi:hypothetical protein
LVIFPIDVSDGVGKTRIRRLFRVPERLKYVSKAGDFLGFLRGPVPTIFALNDEDTTIVAMDEIASEVITAIDNS